MSSLGIADTPPTPTIVICPRCYFLTFDDQSKEIISNYSVGLFKVGK